MMTERMVFGPFAGTSAGWSATRRRSSRMTHVGVVYSNRQWSGAERSTGAERSERPAAETDRVMTSSWAVRSMTACAAMSNLQ